MRRYSIMTEDTKGGTDSNAASQAEVANRFGMLPNFFCTAQSAPGLIEGLWNFAKSAYLDSPLPPLFKERLFVYLSRFCKDRYGIVRHVGFLIGRGKPAGNADSVAESVDQVIALLTRPSPDLVSLVAAFDRLRAQDETAPFPEPRSLAEADLFDALTVIFLNPERSVRARAAVRTAFGNATFEILAAYLAFIRTVHYWSETHPELPYEPDVLAAMEERADFAELLLDPRDAERGSVEDGEEQQWTRHPTESALRASEARFRLYVTTSSDVVYRMSADWSEMRQLDGQGFLADTAEPDQSWMSRYILRDDWESVQSAIDRAIRSRSLFELEHRVRRVDGAVAWTLSRAVPMLDERGEISDWLGTARDVTDRRRAEEILRANELRLRTRNLIAVTRSIFGRTMRESHSMESLESRFNERLESLARVQGLSPRSDQG